MKKIMGRINGLIRIAEKREKKGTEADRLIGRQVIRNLRMVKKIIGEEIVCCPECLSFVSLEDLLEEDSIGRAEAELAVEQGNAGMCIIDGDAGEGKFVRSCDYCSLGVRDEGEEKYEYKAGSGYRKNYKGSHGDKEQFCDLHRRAPHRNMHKR